MKAGSPSMIKDGFSLDSVLGSKAIPSYWILTSGHSFVAWCKLNIGILITNPGSRNNLPCFIWILDIAATHNWRPCDPTSPTTVCWIQLRGRTSTLKMYHQFPNTADGSDRACDLINDCWKFKEGHRSSKSMKIVSQTTWKSISSRALQSYRPTWELSPWMKH